MSWLSRIFSATQREPQPPRGAADQVLAVQRTLDELRPLIGADGGEVELVAVESGVVTLRLRGACKGCAASPQTLVEVIEPRLRLHAFVQAVRTEP